MLPFGELRTEMRRNPKPVCKLIELAANRAYETTYFNVEGAELNPVPAFLNQQSVGRKVRELFTKNKIFRTFLDGIERKDERFLMNDTKAKQCRAGDRLIRKGTRDRALYIVVQGQFMNLDDEQSIYKPGAVLGTKQFLYGDQWDFDLISQGDDGIIGKISYYSYVQLKESQPGTAVRFYNRIIRHMTYELIYARKNNIEYYN